MIRYEIIYADERRIIQKRRPIMRKKSQKFSRFIASANCVNYRNDAIIVEKFNESVRKYKRFADINAAGDEELASEKLRDAGTDLYQSCEWALKNYLYKVAITRFENGEISNEKKGNEIDFLSMKDTNLFKLIDAFKLKSKPDYVTLGINLDTILYGAQKTNNGPKHNATVPDPNTYRKAVGEIRKIIKNYVIDADLDLIEDSIYGSQNVWYELLEETNDFSDAYHYVLVTKTISNINVKGLFSRKWDLVIDFDYDSDVTGLEKEYTKICGVVPWIRMLTKTEANRKFSISNLPYWIMANGCADDPDTIIDESRWKSKYGRYLSDVLEKFHEMYTKPVKVFIYPIDNEKNLERVVEAFDDVYESGDDADYYVLSAQGEYSRIDNGNFRILPLKFKEFCDNLLIHYEADRFIAKSYENQLPTVNKEMVLISEAFAAELRDSFEVVYVGVDRQEEYDATKTSRNYFYRGDIPISWYGLNHNFDVVRKIKTSIIDKIKTDMQDRGRLLKRVCYEPGVGGTTLMRRIAWELREQYPTMILQKYNEQTAKNIQKVYDITHNQILIMVDNNDVELEEAKNLQVELKKMGFSFVICYFERKLKGMHSESGAIYDVVQSLNRVEALEMKNKLQYYIEEQAIEDRLNSIIESMEKEEKTPFIMAMYTFNENFAGIKPYIYGYVDPLLYHMKAMGYSSRISNKYIKDLVRAINDNSEKEKINLINQIENDAQEAFKLYELVRKSNVGIAGHVSEIYMCINVANAIKRVLEESGESFSNYLLQSDGDWVMKYVDRATDLWEEVKKIAPETNSEELEQLEIRIKQLTSDLEGTISLWEDYVNSDTTIDKTQASILAESELPKLLRELKQKSMNLYNRTVPQHWLVNEGTGLSMLYSNSRSKKNAISEEEMAKKMRLIVGRISNNYVNESHAYINYHGTEIYFNPSATKGEIDKSKINQRVKFGIGFS